MSTPRVLLILFIIKNISQDLLTKLTFQHILTYILTNVDNTLVLAMVSCFQP